MLKNQPTNKVQDNKLFCEYWLKILNFFNGDYERAKEWWSAQNSNLGNCTPWWTWDIYQEKVISLIDDQLIENKNRSKVLSREISILENYIPAPFDKLIFLKEDCYKCGHKLARVFYIDGRYQTYCPGENHND